MEPPTANPASSRVADERRQYISLLRTAKKDPAAALSWRLLVRPHESPTSSSLAHDARAPRCTGCRGRCGRWPFGLVAAPAGQPEGRDDYVGGDMYPDTRPPDRHAGVEVHHGGQGQPALPRAQVGDVAHELVGGHGAGEVARHQVRLQGRALIRYRGALLSVGCHAAYAQLAHALAHAVERHEPEFGRQERVHHARPEAAVALKPHALHGVVHVAPLVRGRAVGQPRVEAQPGHLEQPCYHLNRVFGLLR